jgi:hypothetical protein
MNFASSGSGVRHINSRPLQESLGSQSSQRREVIFSFLRVAVMKKGLPPQAGSNLFIATGSVDMNIILLFLHSCSVAQGLLQAGREIFFFFSRKYASTG